VGRSIIPSSERMRTTVPVGLLCPSRRCRLIAASAFRQPLTACSTSLPAQHLRPSGLFSCRPPAPQSGTGTFFPISSGTRPLVQTVSDVCLKRICSLDTSAFSVLEVLDDNRAIYQSINLLSERTDQPLTLICMKYVSQFNIHMYTKYKTHYTVLCKNQLNKKYLAVWE